MATRDYGYEYFCGANVVLEIEGMPILECAGISLSISESKKPIYGYSSRHFDAVGQGTLLINYVHQDYLFKAIDLAFSQQNKQTSEELLSFDLRDELRDPDEVDSLIQKYLQDPEAYSALPAALKDKYNTSFLQELPTEFTPNPFDAYGGIDAKVTFGNREVYNLFTGKTGLTVNDIYITGRGLQISVSEDVIVEEYPFFFRNMSRLITPYRTLYTPIEVNGAPESEISFK
jgi:hypothetical protein